ncbi:MAG: 5-amino-6-(D-ribitylamino)uracil--L-tyrosine 4-hydroxyphenyl transferase CofH, partial [Actinomycetota bacterium]|nr:5-amino-6-(D-ribitylamino)uracil--L-tyrosine 4-hydroxyphenyl transferase CofH [Actinomycetota bacterium]
DTAMRGMPDAELDDLAATIAVARLVLGPSMRIQAPPNLVDEEHALLLRAGIDDWGGVSPLTPDHVNPERPWPQIDHLAQRSAEQGFELRERLTVYPPYLSGPWLDPRLRPHVDALAGPDGLANADAPVVGRAWQDPEDALSGSGRVDLHVGIDTEGRSSDRRDDFDSVYGDWAEVGRRVSSRPVDMISADVRTALRHAAENPASLSDDEAYALMTADGAALEELCALADAVRRDTVGDTVTYVVNRNINFTNICYTGCRFCAFAQRASDADAYSLSLRQIGDRAAQAWELGATEVCMQGGIDPALGATAYFDIVAEVKRRVPQMHVHAFSPMEVVNGANRAGMSVRSWLQAAKDAGLDSIPGTAAEILDDDVRWVLTKGKLPASAWIEVVTTAHALGIPSSSTMMYGHVDHPGHWVAHLRTIARIQRETGGFTEFVPLPFVHTNAPIYLAGIARPGPTASQNRAVHAVARLMLDGLVDHVQCSWVKLGDTGVQQLLQGGCDDLGGTLMEETISRMAGSEHGSAKTVAELEALAAAIGRPVRQRTTTYGTVEPTVSA